MLNVIEVLEYDQMWLSSLCWRFIGNTLDAAKGKAVLWCCSYHWKFYFPCSQMRACCQVTLLFISIQKYVLTCSYLLDWNACYVLYAYVLNSPQMLMFLILWMHSKCMQCRSIWTDFVTKRNYFKKYTNSYSWFFPKSKILRKKMSFIFNFT